MNEAELKLILDLAHKELMRGLKMFPTARTLGEMKTLVEKQDFKYWKDVFQLWEKLIDQLVTKGANNE